MLKKWLKDLLLRSQRKKNEAENYLTGCTEQQIFSELLEFP